MNTAEIFILALSLSMDAFTLSILKGGRTGTFNFKPCIIIALWFSSFQSLMPIIGYLMGESLAGTLRGSEDLICAFIFLILSVNMLLDREDKKREKKNAEADKKTKDFERGELSFIPMITAAAATSLDALTAGAAMAFLKAPIYKSIVIIGMVTFLMCFTGAKLGQNFSGKYKDKAQRAGGIILLILALKSFYKFIK